jgi:hypothetical protein
MAVNPPGNRSWIWYFVVLAVLGVIAAAIPLVYNLRQQLKPADLQAAQELWKAKGPASYVLEYSKHGSVNNLFIVTVRNGRVESVIMKASADDPGRPLEERFFIYHSMLGLFGDIERFLEVDAKPNAPRAFNRALFDPNDGHLRHYVRSAPDQRLEIRVLRLTPLP